jgi:hypothetical protein
MTIKETLKGLQRAIVWANDKSGKRLEATWLFKIPEAPPPPPPAAPANAPVTAPASAPVAGSGTHR